MNLALVSRSALVHKSITDVTRRKGHTIIVVLAIFIGVFSLTAVNVYGFKIVSAFASQLDPSDYPDIIVSVDHVDPVLLTQIASLPNVQTVQEQMTERFQWQTSAGLIPLDITAFQDLQHPALGKFDLAGGHYPDSGEIVMEMGDGFLEPVSLNQSIPVQGPKGNTHLRVSGLAQTSGLPLVKETRIAQGYMRLSDLGQLRGTMTINSLAIKVRNINTVHDTAQFLHNLIQKQDPGLQNTVTISHDVIGFNFIIGFLLSFLNIVRVLAMGVIVVSCFLIMNTFTTLIAEQMRIIGIMKAIGGTQRDILKGYLLTVLIYSILGTFAGLVLGIAFGYISAWAFLNLRLIYIGPFTIPLNVFLMSIGAGIGAPSIAALLTIVDGTRITARAALGGYGVTSVNASTNRRLSSLTERLVLIPQTVWLGLRGIFRKRGRAIMTICALALSGSAFLAAATFTSSLNQRVQQLYTNFAYDLTVSQTGSAATQTGFSLSLPQLRQLLNGIPNIARVERENETIVTTPWGILNLEGVDADTQIYSKPIVAGRWFRPGEQNVLLLDKQMLQKAHLSVGDTLIFTDDNGHNNSWKIIGVVNDKPNLIVTYGVALTDVENVNRLEGRTAQSVNMLYIQARTHSPAALQQLTSQVNQAMQVVGNAAPASTKQDDMQAAERNALVIDIIFYMAAAGIAMAGLLGLYNTLTGSVLERQREIGVWRAMGASNWQVSRVFWIEGLSLALLAWLGGSLIGIPIAYGFVSLVSSWLFPIPFTFDVWSLPLMLLALIIITTLACFGPTARASRVRIATILRYE